MHRRARSVLVVCSIFFGAMAVLFVYAARYPLTPELPLRNAAALISGAPEFNRYGRMVAVESTTRGADSLKDSYYSAKFTFIQNGSTTPTQAQADFGYGNGAWHLKDFMFGSPPDVDLVWVQQDAPGRSK